MSRKLYRKNTVKVYIRIFLTVSVMALLCASIGCFYYGILKPSDWSESISLDKNPVTGTIKVKDLESKVTLFWYHEAPSAYPVKIKKLDSKRWIVVFEKPSNTKSNTEIEQISESEWKVLLNK